jgi:hypothetical protein
VTFCPAFHAADQRRQAGGADQYQDGRPQAAAGDGEDADRGGAE